MKISVLMAVYYKENPHYLHEALESIWDKQTVKPAEIILVEDGKLTGELYETIDRWQTRIGSRLKSVKLPRNQGLAKALNVGIDHCTEELIARMDSDDISAPDRFEKQNAYFSNNPDLHLLGGSIQEFDSDNTCLNVRKFPSNNNAAKKYIAKASPVAHGSVMFRKSIFSDGIRYSEVYVTSQDTKLWFRLLKLNYKMANLEDVIYYFRISENFYSRRSRNKAFKEFKIYWYGIYELHGITWRLVFPVLRLMFRMLPSPLIKIVYNSKIRKALNH